MSYPAAVCDRDDDGGSFPVVPDLPGSAAHGETPEEPPREAQTAQERWREAARARGWPAPEPFHRPAP